MTRLQTNDIHDISSHLTDHDKTLRALTGRSLQGIACHTWNTDEQECIRHQQKGFSIYVVPVTAGLGVITSFSETVCAILNFMGFTARVTDRSDTSGIAEAYESKADAVMMSDDDRFVGINLHTHRVVDNSVATGRVFAAALDLMAGGLQDQKVLVMGCGPVGRAAVAKLSALKARVGLYDCRVAHAVRLQESFCANNGHPAPVLQVETSLESCLAKYRYILEATPSPDTIPENLILEKTMVAAPGVPLGISKQGCKRLQNRLIHDRLELGVAAMAVDLLPTDN